jgi:hypothetical protein
MRIVVAVAVLTLATASAVIAADREPASEIRPRVDHHLREAAQITRHLEALLAADCPRFASVAEWNAYVDREVDQVLLMAAHLEQAWAEAKRTDDDEVRQAAKAPRRRIDEAPKVVEKISACAELNGTTFSPGRTYRRIERDLPQRQAEIALPR